MADKVKNLKIEILWDSIKEFIIACGDYSKSQKYRASEEAKGKNPQSGYGSLSDLKEKMEIVKYSSKKVNNSLIELGLNPISTESINAWKQHIVDIYGPERSIYYALIANHRKRHDLPDEVISTLIKEWAQKKKEKEERKKGR